MRPSTETDEQTGAPAPRPLIQNEPRSYGMFFLVFFVGLFVGAVGACFALRVADPWTGKRITIESAPPDHGRQLIFKIDEAKRPPVMGDPVTETRPGPQVLVEYGGKADFTITRGSSTLLGFLTMQHRSMNMEIQVPPDLTSGALVLSYY